MNYTNYIKRKELLTFLFTLPVDRQEGEDCIYVTLEVDPRDPKDKVIAQQAALLAVEVTPFLAVVTSIVRMPRVQEKVCFSLGLSLAAFAQQRRIMENKENEDTTQPTPGS